MTLHEEEIRCLARLTWYTPIAKSYVQEHLNEHAEFTVYVCKQDEHLICAKLQGVYQVNLAKHRISSSDSAGKLIFIASILVHSADLIFSIPSFSMRVFKSLL
jgi:hypothetical protein